MAKQDYTEFDKALLAQIDAGRNTMMKLDSVSSGLIPLATQFCAKDRWGGIQPAFRVIDRRLQALRKSGKLWFNGKAWERMSARGAK